jgi:hypothetical protein
MSLFVFDKNTIKLQTKPLFIIYYYLRIVEGKEKNNR